MTTYTPESVREALLENADFEEVASLTKAKAFVTAANRWMLLNPESQSNLGSSMSMGKQQIENLLIRARDFVAANDTSANGSRVKFLGMSDFR